MLVGAPMDRGTVHWYITVLGPTEIGHYCTCWGACAAIEGAAVTEGSAPGMKDYPRGPARSATPAVTTTKQRISNATNKCKIIGCHVTEWYDNEQYLKMLRQHANL